MKKSEVDRYSSFEQSHWWFVARRAMIYDFVSNHADRNRKSVLDLGCASGEILRQVFHDTPNRVGVDIEPSLIAKARTLDEEGIYVLADINTLPFTTEKFDLIMLLDVLSHDSIKDKHKLLCQIQRFLSNDGKILICDGAFDCLKGAHSVEVEAGTRFSKASLTQLLNESGFRTNRMRYWGQFLFPFLLLKRRVFDGFLLQDASSSDLRPTPKAMNNLLVFLLYLERAICRFINPSFGTSIIVLAERTMEPK